MKLTGILAGVALAAFTGVAAQAAVVDFENYAGTDVQNGSPIVSGGYSFADPFSPGAWNSGPHSDNGTENLIYGFGPDNLLTMTQVGGGTFSVSQFDAGLSFYTALTSFVVTLTGNISGGGTVTDTFTVVDGYTTFNFGNLTNLTSLTFTAPSDGYIAVDNIGVNGTSVPEPAGWALMLVGLGGLGAAMRSSRAKRAVI